MGVEPGVFTTRRGAQHAATAADDVDAAASTSTAKSLEHFGLVRRTELGVRDEIKAGRCEAGSCGRTRKAQKRKAGSKDPALQHSIEPLAARPAFARLILARFGAAGYSISSRVKASSGSTKYSISRSSSSSSGVGGGGGGGSSAGIRT
jgi:hypothetical protein